MRWWVHGMNVGGWAVMVAWSRYLCAMAYKEALQLLRGDLSPLAWHVENTFFSAGRCIVQRKDRPEKNTAKTPRYWTKTKQQKHTAYCISTKAPWRAQPKARKQAKKNKQMWKETDCRLTFNDLVTSLPLPGLQMSWPSRNKQPKCFGVWSRHE